MLFEEFREIEKEGFRRWILKDTLQYEPVGKKQEEKVPTVCFRDRG